MRKPVVSYKSLPQKSPLPFAAITYLLFEHFQAPEWMYWTVGIPTAILVLVWLANKIWFENPVELFRLKNDGQREGEKKKDS